jgi:hypothetical protein
MLMDVRRVVAPLLLAGLLVGCSDDGPSSGPPEASDSAPISPTTTETADAPADPEAAVREWFRLLSAAFESLDTSDLKAASAHGCVTCRGFVQAIDRTAAAGGSFAAPPWEITRLKKITGTKSAAVLLVNVHEPAGTSTRRAGDEPTPFPALDDRFQFYVTKRHQTWVVTTIGMLN